MGKCEFLVKWQGYGHSHNQWRPYDAVTKPAIMEYLQSSGQYDHTWKHRCPHCDKPCRSATGVKVHYASKCKKYDREQSFAGTVANALHAEAVKEERQKQEGKVLCEGEQLKNCFQFKYLGSMFTADGSEDFDLRRRIGSAMSRSGQLRFILGAKNVSFATKMKIYRCAVGSLFTYGSEAWTLSDKTMRKLNGANASCLSRFTGKTKVEESRPATCTYSLVNDIRRRRLIWLGHILRMQEDRLVRKATEVQFLHGRAGNLFMDAPTGKSFEELTKLAEDRKTWKKLVATKFGSGKAKPKKKKPNAEPRDNSPAENTTILAAPTAKTSGKPGKLAEIFCRDRNPSALKQQRQIKKKKGKQAALTNAERQELQRKHWEQT